MNKATGRPRVADRMFYGWIMVPVAMAAIMCTAPAQTYGVSVFNKYIRESLHLTGAQVAGAYTLGTLLSCVPLTLVGHLMDRHGIRRTMIGIVLLFTGACVFLANTWGLISLFLAFWMLRLFGQGSMMILASNTLPQWFNRKLGLVSGLFALAPAAAIAVAPSLHLWLIHRFGWRTAYVILGLGISGIMLPLLALVFRNRPEDVGQRTDNVSIALDAGVDGTINQMPPAPAPSSSASPDQSAGEAVAGSVASDERAFTLAQAWRTRAYWIMCIDTMFNAMAKTAVTFSIVSILATRDLPDTDAARMFIVFGVTAGAARLAAGFLADHLPLNVLMAGASLFMAGTLGCLWAAVTPAMVMATGVLMGLQQGAKGSVGGTLWVRYYGRAHLGKIKGSFTTAMVAASSIGPLLLEGMREFTGSYDTILLVLALIPLPLGVAALFATKPVPPGG